MPYTAPAPDTARHPARPSDRLADAIARAGSPVCVGLDPVLEKLPAALRAQHWEPTAAIAGFCEGVLRAAAGSVPAVKVQSACFERYGHAGVRVLEDTCRLARSLGLVVILDAKRGDIGISSAHYAAAALHAGADFITVSGYLGPSGVEPFLDAGLGAFVLVRTSNPDSDAVQARALAEGGTVAEMMADTVALAGHSRIGEHGLSDVGAVVGATKSAEGESLRGRMPHQVFLVPGYGAQGGTPDDIRALLRPTVLSGGSPQRAGVLVTASRSVIYAFSDERGRDAQAWQDDVASAARRLAGEIRDIVAQV